MIGFFIKKSFFDGWDHLFAVLLLNLGFIAAAAVGLALPEAFGLSGPAAIAFVAVALAAASIWFSTCVHALKGVSDFGSFYLRDLGAYLKQGLVPGLQTGLFTVGCYLILSVGLPFYLQVGGIMGALAAGVVFWCTVVMVLALQYYIPLRARLGGGLRKNLRKSFILFFDNPGFSFFLFLYCAVNLALSLCLAFLIPGFAGVALAEDVALRLRLYKYDWIEEHPEENRRRVPWDELLEEDRELVGKRTLKGMFFPWKE
jgi:uncharacterized membrane protein YesL